MEFRGNRQELEAITDYAEATNIKNVFADLTQKLSKDKPEDFIAYLIAELTANPVKVRPRPPRHLRAEIEKMFKDADADGNGHLDRTEFKTIFTGLKDTLRLSNKDIKKIMAEADENDDGLIAYEEFVPIAMDVIESIYNQMEIVDGEWREATMAEEQADNFLRGQTEEELLAILKDVFMKADSDGNGWLDRSEFKKCIQDCELGFTRKEINVLMSEVDLDGDGHVTYEEFAPMCYNMLVTMVSKDLLTDPPAEQQDLKDQLFAMFDQSSDKKGKINHAKAMEYIMGADLGLNRIHAASCLNEVEQDKHGLMAIEDAAEKAALAVFTFWQQWGM